VAHHPSALLQARSAHEPGHVAAESPCADILDATRSETVVDAAHGYRMGKRSRQLDAAVGCREPRG
jgi:hypothetical protein